MALGAVGNASAVSLLVIGFIQGMTNGFTAVISRFAGSGDRSGLQRAIALSVKICGIISVVLTALSVAFLRSIFTLMQTDPEIMESSLIYGHIVFSGLVITAAYELCSCILRGLLYTFCVGHFYFREKPCRIYAQGRKSGRALLFLS